MPVPAKSGGNEITPFKSSANSNRRGFLSLTLMDGPGHDAFEKKRFHPVFELPNHGCGKTTTMRMIACLETVTEGEIKIGGKNVVGMIPRERDVAMVFQNYALFPHLDVFGNLSFGLRLRKVPKEQVAEKVRSAAKILDIEHLYWNASPRNFLEVSVSELRSAEPSSENLRSF
jgi:ABC-type antimicrobial peptide transport system ATPase subunit